MPIVSDRTRSVSQEAAYWYIRCSDERAMRRQDRKLLLEWLTTSRENVAEILRIADMDGKFERQRLIEVFDNLDSNVYDINSGAQVLQYDYNPSDSVSDKVSRKTRLNWSLAAVCAALAVSALLWVLVLKNPAEGTVTTAVNQRQQTTLSDGSTIHMDARTNLRVEFTAERRAIYLDEGQAVFEVTKDPDRPFIVITPIVDVTAIGTRFGVAIHPGVTTTVSEGVVKVTAHGEPDDAAAVRVHAGEQLRVLDGNLGRELRVFGGRSVDLSKVESIRVDAVRKLDWVSGWVTFRNETIDEMVDEFNRRNVLQIEIDDPRIAHRRLPPGYYRFRLDNPESFVKVLDSQEGIAVIRDGSDELRLKLE